MKAGNTIAAVMLCAMIGGCQKDEHKQQSFTINAEKSKLEWKGSAPDHFHEGAFDVEGEFTTDKKGKIIGGDFTIPIASISNYDLPDGPKQELLTHLKSADFFNVVVHPTAEYYISSVVPYTGTDGSAIQGANYLVNGVFTMLGESHPLNFPARITRQQDTITTAAKFKLNRLIWGMDSFNDPNGPLYLLPDVEIALDIKALEND